MSKRLDYNATMIERRDVTETLAIFRIFPDRPLEGERPFLPGQYVTVALPAGGDWVQRPMSIASAPEDERGIEIYVRKVWEPVSEHPFSHLLFETKPNDRIYLRPAATGRFTLSHTIGEDSQTLKLFVAGGTGIAPFMSMIRSRALRTNGELSDYIIMHGARFPQELAYHEELLRLSMVRGLRYLPSISRPLLSPNWDGMTGRLNDLLLPDRIERTESILGIPIQPDQTSVFVCGLSEMISCTIENLMLRGYVPAHRKLRARYGIPEDARTTLFYEQYDEAPLVGRETASHTVA